MYVTLCLYYAMFYTKSWIACELGKLAPVIFMIQHACWIRACQHRASTRARELEPLEVLALVILVVCYFLD